MSIIMRPSGKPGTPAAEEPKSAIPPLSPTGKVVRRVLIWSSWLVPVSWVVVIGTVYVAARSGTPNLLLWIALAIGIFGLPVVLVGWLVFLAVFRLRARLLEMLLILSTVSLLPGMLFSDTPTTGSVNELVSLLGKFALALCASACWIGGGAVWGLSVSQRYGEERTWVRLGYIALGWAMLTGFVAVVPFCFAAGAIAVSLFFSAREDDWGSLLATLGVTSPLVAAAVTGLVIERRCRKTHGPVNL